jgi:hypothetical protein
MHPLWPAGIRRIRHRALGMPARGPRRIHGPLRRTCEIGRAKRTGAAAGQPSRRRAGQQGHQLRTPGLPDARLAPYAGTVTEPVQPSAAKRAIRFAPPAGNSQARRRWPALAIRPRTTR